MLNELLYYVLMYLWVTRRSIAKGNLHYITKKNILLYVRETNDSHIVGLVITSDSIYSIQYTQCHYHMLSSRDYRHTISSLCQGGGPHADE